MDIEKCKSLLGTSKTLSELGDKWTSLTPKEKSTAEVLAEKDRLKTVLK